MTLTFLEARKILESVHPETNVELFVGMSGSVDPLLIFLEAAAAERGYAANISFPAFGTLQQALRTEATSDLEVFVLFPWDVIPEADWRTGVSWVENDLDEVELASRQMWARIRSRATRDFFYVDAPIPPLGPSLHQSDTVRAVLRASALREGARVMEGSLFSLGDYLGHGSPFGGKVLGEVGSRLVDGAVGPGASPKKVLVTDFDNTLWGGVLAEEGLDGIHHGPSGVGYRHFVYQTLLGRLKSAGGLLAAVTRNSPDIVAPALESGSMVLGKDDFVSVVASYNAKSSQIQMLADALNLGLDSFVFVDDNPIEIAEVEQALPEVTCVRFCKSEADLPDLVNRLAHLFERTKITEEDKRRTALYRARLGSLSPSDLEGADLEGFLGSLEMRLRVTDRSTDDRTRAVQLINKTNQFNLNGRRWSDDEIEAVLAAGGRLVCASLSDRSGDHGEVVACLIDRDGSVLSWVMSCRVFQRRLEHAFLLSLVDFDPRPRILKHVPTNRNEPMRDFLKQSGLIMADDETVTIDWEEFQRSHASYLDLFRFQA